MEFLGASSEPHIDGGGSSAAGWDSSSFGAQKSGTA